MEMTSLDDIAMSNLKILSSGYNRKLGVRLIIDGNILHEVDEEDDTYDRLFTLKHLEYPVFFSFSRARWMFDRAGRLQRRELLDLLDYSLDTIYKLIEDTDESEDIWISFKRVACSLDDMYSEMDEIHLQKTFCHRAIERTAKHMERYFDEFVDMLADTRRYLYLTPDTIDLTIDSDEENETENEIDSESEKDK
jgi:hypothetical protein